MNKSIVTNSAAFLLAVAGPFSPVIPHILGTIGLFAFSGAITNWLAIHMLFEKVPFLYGSGVIPNRFEDFKSGIRGLIMKQFFTSENIHKFMDNQSAAGFNLTPLLETVEYDKIFDSLVETIKESSFGSMLGMFGGDAALAPLKDPFEIKMKATLNSIVQDDAFQNNLGGLVGRAIDPAKLESKIGGMVDSRLEELTPAMVKEIIQEMIRQHLGWLVVWGGVFGGIIGLISALISAS